MTYRADVDGLRALAVMAVLLFHADLGLSGGYTGVDVFFVISGFLITSLILRDMDAGTFRMVEFWERRVRRILPALAVVVFATLIAGWFFLLPRDFKELGQSAVAQASLLANVYFWRESGYFAQASDLKPLLHTWSLAVEEQFYLVFPFVLLALCRLSRKRIVPMLAFLLVASFGLSEYASHRYPDAAFYLLPNRAWELLIGAALAASGGRFKPRAAIAECLALIGVAALLYANFAYDRGTRFPGIAAILPCGGAALIILANGHRMTSVGRFLSLPAVVFVGLISYSLYLWHWPILVFSRYLTHEPLSLFERLLLVGFCFAMAVLSWRFVETPFRKRVVFKSRRQVFAFGVGATAVSVVAGAMIHLAQGMPGRFPESVLRYANGRSDHAFRREVTLADVRGGKFVELGPREATGPIRIFVWGDSHAKSVLPIIDQMCRERGIRGAAATHSATAPLLGYESRRAYSLGGASSDFNAAVVEFLRRERIENVVLVARWGGYAESPDDAKRLAPNLAETVTPLLQYGASVWIMKPVPEQSYDVPRALAISTMFGGEPEQLGVSRVLHDEGVKRLLPMWERLRELNVGLLDPSEYFFAGGNLCRVADSGAALYCDDHHLSTRGASMLRPLFEPLFAKMAEKSPDRWRQRDNPGLTQLPTNNVLPHHEP